MNYEQAIIGTWVTQDQDETKWVFNTDGTFKWGKYDYKFGVADTKLALSSVKENDTNIYDISISSDGRTLIVSWMYDGGTLGWWFTKKYN